MLFEAFFSQKSSEISVSSKLCLQSFFFKAFSSKLFFSPQSLLFKAPLQSPLSQSLSLKAPPSKPLLSKPFSQSAFLKASSSKPFLQSALLKALSFKTLRSKPLPSLQSPSEKCVSCVLALLEYVLKIFCFARSILIAPELFQDRPMTLPKASRLLQEAPRWPQDPSKMLP